MTSRPPSSLSPSSKLDLDVVSSRMEAKAIPQQDKVMTQNHQATTHQWDAAGAVPTTTSASQPQGQARLTKFRRPSPLKFSGKIRAQPLKSYVRHQQLETGTTSSQFSSQQSERYRDFQCDESHIHRKNTTKKICFSCHKVGHLVRIFPMKKRTTATGIFQEVENKSIKPQH